MPLVEILGEILKSGKVTVFTNNIESLEIKVADKKIDINAVNKKIIKQALAATRKRDQQKGVLGRIGGTVSQIKAARSNLGLLKGTAEELSESGITITLSYKGDVVVTMGSQAKPKFSRVATGTKAIEVNSSRKLIEMTL